MPGRGLRALPRPTPRSARSRAPVRAAHRVSIEPRELTRRSAAGGFQGLFGGEAVVAARGARGFQETEPGPACDRRRRDSEEPRHLTPREKSGAGSARRTGRTVAIAVAGVRPTRRTVALAAARLRPTSRTVAMFHLSPGTALAESQRAAHDARHSPRSFRSLLLVRPLCAVLPPPGGACMVPGRRE
jgi:hypothetical protein